MHFHSREVKRWKSRRRRMRMPDEILGERETRLLPSQSFLLIPRATIRRLQASDRLERHYWPQPQMQPRASGCGRTLTYLNGQVFALYKFTLKKIISQKGILECECPMYVDDHFILWEHVYFVFWMPLWGQFSGMGVFCFKKYIYIIKVSGLLSMLVGGFSSWKHIDNVFRMSIWGQWVIKSMFICCTSNANIIGMLNQVTLFHRGVVSLYVPHVDSIWAS